MSRSVRFAFGENWRGFLEVLDDERIAEAERSLVDGLSGASLQEKTFLDAGCGSGLFSLAALRLGAARVHSFDFDLDSVACAAELRRRYDYSEDRWTVERGDLLDEAYLDSVGKFDVVYCWGVLHHTGNMWLGMNLIERAVGADGSLFLAIYNDQRFMSSVWKAVKRLYNRIPSSFRLPYAMLVMAPRELLSLTLHALRGRPHDYVRSWTRYKSARGMSRWHDLVDWVGGYPFEVARPEEIFDLYRARGFELDRLRTCGGGLGCNEFVFRRRATSRRPVHH